ncbi:LysR family transcriptional regulator [Rothia nasimurium]|uniref:LysR family transcriptional regulator n=1 Tax=Luteibacter anthropi TaxID=564369 RepID=A0A7X5ZK07_9GAMM|nr:LysR family transcriptional regulator [Luteibacter anthropi]NII08389.1 LysR family transcriptional regulator [Luteibacter anthropi]
MELSQLRAFCAVAETGSVIGASRALNKVPSSITVRIQQLEQDLGCPLFLRERQRLSLSPDGRRLLEHAQRIVGLADSTRDLMRNSEVGGRLVVGAVDVALMAFMPALIGRYRSRHRSVELDVRRGASDVLIEQVTDGALDIALGEGPVSATGLASRLAYTDDVVLVTEFGHPPVDSPRDLRCNELYGFRHDSSFRYRVDAWLEASGRQLLPVVEVGSYHTMLACVTAGMGAAWIPRSVLATLPGHPQVRAHALGEAGRSEIHFVWRKTHLSENAERLMEIHRDTWLEK